MAESGSPGVGPTEGRLPVLVAPPLRIVRHGMRLPQLPTVELVYSHGRRSNSRVVSELAIYLADSLRNARPATVATLAL